MSTEIQSWLLPVEPFAGESLSHFLGRFRRQNHLSPSALGDLAGVGAVIARWERFHFNPFPSDVELAAVAGVVGVTPERIRQMLAPEGLKMKCEPFDCVRLVIRRSLLIGWNGSINRLEGAIDIDFGCCQNVVIVRLSFQFQRCGRMVVAIAVDLVSEK